MIKNKLHVETTERELILARVFDVMPELLFTVWSSCEHLKHWWGPKEWPMDECKMDFREGGEWHYCMHGPNEEDESWGKAVYKEIKKPKKIVYQDYFADKDGNINEELPGMLVTVEFAEQDGKTKMVSTTLFDTSEALQKIVEMGVVDGMNSSLDRLDEHLEHVTGHSK